MGLGAGVSLLVHGVVAWRVLVGCSFPDVPDYSVSMSWSCRCPAGGWGLTLEKLAEGLTVPGAGIRLQSVGLLPMGFWSTGEDNQGLGSDCSVLGQVLGPLEGKDGSRRIQMTLPCLWVGLCYHSNNCSVCSVENIVPTFLGEGSYHELGANKIERGFQNGAY